MQLTEGEEDFFGDSSRSFALPCKALSTLYRSLQVIHKNPFLLPTSFQQDILKDNFIRAFSWAKQRAREMRKMLHTKKCPKLFSRTEVNPSTKYKDLTNQNSQVPVSKRQTTEGCYAR